MNIRPIVEKIIKSLNTEPNSWEYISGFYEKLKTTINDINFILTPFQFYQPLELYVNGYRYELNEDEVLILSDKYISFTIYPKIQEEEKQKERKLEDDKKVEEFIKQALATKKVYQ